MPKTIILGHFNQNLIIYSVVNCAVTQLMFARYEIRNLYLIDKIIILGYFQKALSSS